MKALIFFITFGFIATLSSIVLEAAKNKSDPTRGTRGMTQALQALSFDEQKSPARASSLSESEATVEFKLPDNRILPHYFPFSDGKDLFSKLTSVSRTSEFIAYDKCSQVPTSLDLPSEAKQVVLKKLKLKGSGVTDDHVKACVLFCGGLTELDLSMCQQITDAGLEVFAPYFRNFIRLDLEGCFRITSTFFIKFAQNFRNLESLNLYMCNLTDDTCMVLAPKLKNLTHLNLAFCEKLTCRGFDHLFVYIENLIHLNLFGCNITYEGLRKLLLINEKLTYLDIRHCKQLSSKFQRKFTKEDLDEDRESIDKLRKDLGLV